MIEVKWGIDRHTEKGTYINSVIYTCKRMKWWK